MRDFTIEEHGGATRRHEIRRVRHELRRRMLTVCGVEPLTPRMRRIHFHSPELKDFRSASYDDHMKLFFHGPGGASVMRDFTPREFHNQASTLAIDFAMHEAGPATRWAASAQVGQVLEVGGPRGSHVVPDDFDWYLLIGDETALPAIGRRVEELRAGVPVVTVATVFDSGEEQHFRTQAAWTPRWVARGEPSANDADRLLDVVARFDLPPGDGFVWIAGEATIARRLRSHFVERGHPREWARAAGYWQRGTTEARIVIDDD